MAPIELELRRLPRPCREAVAWFVAGSDPAGWVEEAARWSVRHAAIRAIVIRGDGGSPAGALLIPGEGDVPCRPNAAPYGCVAGRAYLPTDAEWSPRLADAELAELLSSDYQYVASPAYGLTAAAPEQVLKLPDLLTLPPLADSLYNKARPGLAIANRLVGISADPIGLDAVFNLGRDDIGELGGDLEQLPKAPDEPLSGATGAVARAALRVAAFPLAALAKMGSAVGSAMGSGARAGGMGPGLGEFAGRLLNRVTEALETSRHKEIGRLLHMLESNPDLGLRYALPFGGGAHRGRARPGSRLGMRTVDFRLGDLGGGGPADVWDLPERFHNQLVTKYRELAARETRLGRHRRAAYIYAELLGDVRAAATALEQGAHYREAATLYRERLEDKRAAARCLEEGGVWDEAIAAYRDLDDYEKAGDLLAGLHRDSEAEEAYHAAAEHRLRSGDYLGAARIHEAKLRDATLALATLDDAWPYTDQAEACVDEAFAVCARYGDHDSSWLRIERLMADAERLGRFAVVAERLTAAHTNYPDESVRSHAALSARTLIATRLRDTPPGEADRLASCLPRLLPEDRLLGRDVGRYRSAARRSESSGRSGRRPRPLRIVARASLGLPGVWRAVSAIGEDLFVAGVMESRLVVARHRSDGGVKVNYRPWPGVVVRSDAELILLGARSPLCLFVAGADPLPEARLFESESDHDASVTGAVRAQAPSAAGHVYGAAAGSLQQVWTIEERQGVPVLVCIDDTGSVVATYDHLFQEGLEWSDVILPIPVHATSRRVLVGAGRALISVDGQEVEVIDEFASPIHGLYGGPPYASPIVAAATDEGAFVYHLVHGGSVHRIAHDLVAPRLLINPGGFVVAADAKRIEVYRMAKDSRGVSPVLYGEIAMESGAPIAILKSSQTDRFTVISDKGSVLTLEVAPSNG